MKQDILHDRYDFTENDKAIIDISLDTLGDLFNAFDRKTSFYKRDLNQDFEDYLIASVKELEGHDFIIRLNIEKELTKDSEETIKKAIRNHFRFLYWQERKKFSKVILQFIILTILGIALLLACRLFLRFYISYCMYSVNFKFPIRTITIFDTFNKSFFG